MRDKMAECDRIEKRMDGFDVVQSEDGGSESWRRGWGRGYDSAGTGELEGGRRRMWKRGQVEMEQKNAYGSGRRKTGNMVSRGRANYGEDIGRRRKTGGGRRTRISFGVITERQ